MTSWLGGDRLRGVICGLLFVAAGLTGAEVVPDLYAVSVPVAEQSPAELQRAATAGLRELAVRISGRSGAANDPALATAFSNATRYLEQYRYERNTGGDSSWLAQLRFASAQIDGELRKAGLPVWGGNRPALQTILVVDDKGTRTIVDENSPLAKTLREQWRRRGLVLYLPRATSAINVDDVLRFDHLKVTASLQEQRSDGLLLGRITLAANGTCDSRWSLNLNAHSFDADGTGSAPAICVANALDRIVDNFSAQYAIAANSSAEGIVLRVGGIVNFDDYAALLSYLRRLTAVKSVQPVLVHDDEVLFQLKIAGSTEQLARQLALESRLTASDNIANPQAGINARLPVALSYRWTATPGSPSVSN